MATATRNDEWLTADEAGERMGVTSSYIRKLVSAGRIPGWRKGNLVLVHIDDIDNFKPNPIGRPKSISVTS